MSYEHEIICNNGKLYAISADTEEPGVMLDFYNAKPSPRDRSFFDQLVDKYVKSAGYQMPEDDDEADNYMIVPFDAVRKLGEALIAMADAYDEDWKRDAQELGLLPDDEKEDA